jgi:hypothetical protein
VKQSFSFPSFPTKHLHAFSSYACFIPRLLSVSSLLSLFSRQK